MSDIWSLAAFFGGMSLLAIGGGNATLPAIQQHAVWAGWVSNEGFLGIYALGQVAPGPSTMYVAGTGYTAGGIAGGLVAGLAFVLPSALLVIVAGTAWARWPDSTFKHAIRAGLAPVAVALVAVGAWNLIRALESLSDGTRHNPVVALSTIAAITLATAMGAQWTRISPALFVLGGGLVGFLVLG